MSVQNISVVESRIKSINKSYETYSQKMTAKNQELITSATSLAQRIDHLLGNVVQVQNPEAPNLNDVSEALNMYEHSLNAFDSLVPNYGDEYSELLQLKDELANFKKIDSRLNDWANEFSRIEITLSTGKIKGNESSCDYLFDIADTTFNAIKKYSDILEQRKQINNDNWIEQAKMINDIYDTVITFTYYSNTPEIEEFNKPWIIARSAAKSMKKMVANIAKPLSKIGATMISKYDHEHEFMEALLELQSISEMEG